MIGRGQPLCVITGPCVLEGRAMALEVGRAVRDRCGELGLSYIFKASFDKANRSSVGSRRGPGLEEGVATLVDVGRELCVPVTTDIHLPEQAACVAEGGADLLQIPAFLCRQTDLLLAAAETGRAVNVKKGQFLSPGEMKNVVDKLAAGGCEHMMLTERGTFFGYGRLVNDFVGLGDMMEMGWPVCFDATHSTQQPGGLGATSGGRPERAGLLARAAVAAGVDAVFLETHPDPANAVSDAAVQLEVGATLELLGELAGVRAAVVSEAG